MKTLAAILAHTVPLWVALLWLIAFALGYEAVHARLAHHLRMRRLRDLQRADDDALSEIQAEQAKAHEEFRRACRRAQAARWN